MQKARGAQFDFDLKHGDKGAARIGRVLAAGLLVAVVGCQAPALSKAEFIARGDRLCRRFEQRSQRVQLKSDPFQPGATPADLQAAPRFLDFFAANLPQLAGDLRGLGPPDEDRALLEKTLMILDGSGREFATAKRAFQAGDHDKAKATLDRAFGRLEEAARSAQQYGFKECGSAATEDRQGTAARPGPEIQITANEYAFQIPAELASGPHTFSIRNEGKERHFLALRRLKPGIGVQRLIDSEKAGEPITDLVEQNLGQSETALPGMTVRFAADLLPGNYAYACFIAAPDGRLHAYKGMAGLLTVKQP